MTPLGPLSPQQLSPALAFHPILVLLLPIQVHISSLLESACVKWIIKEPCPTVSSLCQMTSLYCRPGGSTFQWLPVMPWMKPKASRGFTPSSILCSGHSGLLIIPWVQQRAFTSASHTASFWCPHCSFSAWLSPWTPSDLHWKDSFSSATFLDNLSKCATCFSPSRLPGSSPTSFFSLLFNSFYVIFCFIYCLAISPEYKFRQDKNAWFDLSLLQWITGTE